MKKYLFLFPIFLLMSFSSHDMVNDVTIDVTLDSIGNGEITEKWDVELSHGTEFYLVRNNLRDIQITDLSVTDESQKIYSVIDPWVSKGKSLEEKNGQCGIAKTKNGVEICWGLGSYGKHVYTVRYKMSNMVQQALDADILHFQFISDGISPLPSHAVVKIHSDYFPDSCQVKGFGYHGTCIFDGNTIVAETSKEFEDDNSIIVLASFPKGTFASSSKCDKSLNDILENAEDDDSMAIIVALTFGFIGILMIVIGAILIQRGMMRNVTGCSTMEEIVESDTLPFNGNIMNSFYALTESGNYGMLTCGIVMKLVRDGYAAFSTDRENHTIMTFPDKEISQLTESEAQFLGFMKEAAGEDFVLENKEMDKWSLRHSSKLSKWLKNINKETKRQMKEDGYLNQKNQFTDKGKAEGYKVLAYHKYLERHITELYKIDTHMVFASLYGLVDKHKKHFRQQLPLIYYILLFNHNVNSSVNNVTMSNVSVSGGGGFSGGGHGGGCR